MKSTPSPLQRRLDACVGLLETTLQPSTLKQYRYTVRLFLKYLQDQYPEIRLASQLRRDPHLLGWLELLWKWRTSQGRPLDSATRGHHVMQLRTLLEMLADFPHP